MKIPPRDIASVLARPSPAYLCYFFHGADTGLIKERAAQIANQICSDRDDPFQSISLRGEDLKSDPLRLSEEVSAIAMFGAERLVHVKGTGTELLDAVKKALPDLASGTRLVIEASDTTTRHALVKLCEADKKTASIGCYSDEDRDIGQLARQILAQDKISIDQDALTLLISRLGSDRLASRSEIEKLALMAGPNGSLTLEDIEQAIGDSSAQAIDNIMKSVFSGDVPSLAITLEKARMEELAPIAILRQMAQSCRQVFEATSYIAQGESAASAIAKLRPPAHFKTKPLLTSVASRLSQDAALAFWQKTTSLEADLKSGRIPDPYTHIGQGLLGLCLRLRPRKT